MQQGHISQAIDEYRAALRINPGLTEPLTELAWTLSTSPSASLRNADEAVALGERARSATNGRDVLALDALGAAYANAGRFDDAVRTIDAALQLIPSDATGRRGHTASASRAARVVRGGSVSRSGEGER